MAFSGITQKGPGGRGGNAKGCAPGTPGSKASIKDYSIGSSKPSTKTSGTKASGSVSTSRPGMQRDGDD